MVPPIAASLVLWKVVAEARPLLNGLGRGRVGMGKQGRKQRSSTQTQTVGLFITE